MARYQESTLMEITNVVVALGSETTKTLVYLATKEGQFGKITLNGSESSSNYEIIDQKDYLKETQKVISESQGKYCFGTLK